MKQNENRNENENKNETMKQFSLHIKVIKNNYCYYYKVISFDAKSIHN